MLDQQSPSQAHQLPLASREILALLRDLGVKVVERVVVDFLSIVRRRRLSRQEAGSFQSVKDVVVVVFVEGI